MRPRAGPQFIDKGGTAVIDSLPRGPSWDLRVSAPGCCPGQPEEESMGRLTRILAAMAIVVLGVTACGTSNSAGGKIGGTLYTLYAWASLKGLVWYDPKAFQAKGYQIPKTWDELMTLQDKIKSDGGKPWCVALESQAASGWPGSDWVKEIVLSQSGSTVYDSWWQGKQKWTSTEIKQAWTTWGKVLGSGDSNVFGGSRYMVATTFGDGGQGLFKSPPQRYMFHPGSVITSLFDAYNPKATPGTDFPVFPFPHARTPAAG